MTTIDTFLIQHMHTVVMIELLAFAISFYFAREKWRREMIPRKSKH